MIRKDLITIKTFIFTYGLLIKFFILPDISFAQPAIRNWQGEQLLTGSTNSWEPFIATDPLQPWVYAVWFNPSGPAPCTGCSASPIMFQSSSDGGVTWGSPKWLTPGAGQQGQYDPTIKVVKNTGAVYATWMIGNQIMFSKSLDHGIAWTIPLKISGPQWADHPWFGMSADGKDIYAFWSKGDIYAVCSHNFGLTWTAPMKINSDKNRQYYPEGVEVLSDGTIIVSAISYPCSKGTTNCVGIINISTFKSTNLGVSYAQKRIDQIFTGPQYMTNGLETIASDDLGNLVLAYNGALSIGTNNQMYVRTSTDKGTSWSLRKTISTSATADACFPAIVGFMNGNFRFTYYDNRTGAFNIYYRESNDNGATWSNDVRLSEKSTGAAYKSSSGFGAPYGDYSGLAVTSSGESIAIFGESAVGQTPPGGIWINRTLPSPLSSRSSSTSNNLLLKDIHLDAYPNPFSEKITFQVHTPQSSFGNLSVFNIMGQKIKVIYEGMIEKGINHYEFNVPSDQSNILIYNLSIGGKQYSGKLLHIGSINKE